VTAERDPKEGELAPDMCVDDPADAANAPRPRARRGLTTITKATYLKEALLKNLFLLCACVAVAGVGLIFLFVGLRGWPIFQKVGIWQFLTGAQWFPTKGSFGILPLIVNSMLAMAGALALGARPTVELLAGIPSVVYGFFGLILLRPIVAEVFGGLGFGLFTVWLILAVMILPTIAALTEDALRSVPKGIREASYAMGATKWQTIWRVLLPAAKIGIIDAVILGMGRAIGETMAVVMVAGNARVIPDGIFKPFLTLTTVIVMDMPYAAGDHRTALFGVAIVLFLISMVFVAAIRVISRFGKEMS
jgi:ABC-type phosphate transport system permease subunit